MNKRWRTISCGCHSHSDIGSPDGGSTIKSIVSRSIELGRTHVCLTDHGSMAGLASLWDACEEKRNDKKNPYDIRPIHGIEAYINTPWDEPKVLKNGKVELGYSHLTIHFKTKKAYQYFCRLTPIMEQRAVVKYGEKKPIMTLDELRDIAEEITIGSGCLGSMIARHSRKGDFETAEKIYCTLREMVGQDDWFVELMPHRLTNNWVRPETSEDGTVIREGYFKDNDWDDGCDGPLDVQRGPNAFILHLARKYRDKVLISEDSHIASPEDYLTQVVRMGNGKDAWRFSIPYAQMSEEHWYGELRKQLGQEFTDSEFESWIENSHVFASRFGDYEFDTIKDRAVMPTVQSVFGIHEVKSAKELIFDAIREEGRMPAPGTPDFPVYFERLRHELSVIADNGRADYLPYFLQVRRVVKEMRDKKNLATPRGSAGGSLLLYLIGVSISDPIKYRLSFGRFLTLGRIQGGSMPDADIDFSQQSQVFEFLQSEYGDRFSRLTNCMMMKLKTTIKDVERLTNGRVSPETMRMCKILPDTPQGMEDYKFVYGYTDKDSGSHVPGLLEQIKDGDVVVGYQAGMEEEGVPELVEWTRKNPEMWKTVEQCLGTARGNGVHACGTLLAPHPISHYLPVSLNKDGHQVSMYNGKFAEKVGMMKFDFLGVDALASLSETIKMIEADTGTAMPWQEYPHDPAVYESIIGQNNLSGIFQLSARAIKPYALRMQPRSIVEVSNIIALIRPGALDAPAPDPKWQPKPGKAATAAEYYIAVKNGETQPYYFHPDMESIVKDTCSVVLFQEQLIEIFKKIGEMSDADADEARRACGKKDKALLENTLDKLVPGAKKRGWTDEQISTLKATVMASARYSFNCMSRDQQILTDRGLMTIPEISQDHEVKVAFILNDVVCFERPAFAGQTATSELTEYTLSDGTKITCTPDHKIMTVQGWMGIQEALENEIELPIRSG